SAFNQDISDWDISSATDMQLMFRRSAIDQNLCAWGSYYDSLIVNSQTIFENMFLESRSCTFQGVTPQSSLGPWCSCSFLPSGSPSKVRIQHNGEGRINIMEVEVYSEGNNVALQSNGGTAKLSSTLTSSNSAYTLDGFTAIDGDASDAFKFAHSNLEDGTQGVAQLRWHHSPHLKLTDSLNT
ncbi:hypothetical protein THAOC_05771, partial [Thalassiosira oceanica]